jgi:tetratricopeptide (TPR) repeat protein
VAKYKKKRARELKHDKFRDTTMGLVDRAAHQMEGKGRKVLYAIVALIAIALLAWGVMAWRRNKADNARLALGRAIKVAETPVVATPPPGSTAPSFRTEKERAQKALEEFQKVAASYGGTTGEHARYFAAANQLLLDRAKGMTELDALTTSSDREVSALAKFALGQAKEGDAKYDEAAALYADLAKQSDALIAPDTANLRLAMVYQNLGKKEEAANLLFKIVETARQAKGKDGKPAPQSGAARRAADELEKLDPARYAQLPPPTLPPGLAG